MKILILLFSLIALNASATNLVKIKDVAATGVANIALNKLAASTASRACVFDASGFVSPSAVTSTQIGYLGSASGTTGSGNLCLATSPTFVTPDLGVATATSISAANGTTATPSFYTSTGSGNAGFYFGPNGAAFGYNGTEVASFAATEFSFYRPISSKWPSSAAAPAIFLSTENTSGIYRIGANNIGVSISSANVLDIASTGLAVTGTLSSTGVFSAGVSGSSIGGVNVSGNTSGTVSIKPQAAAGTYNFNLPTTAGSSGQALLSGGGGAAAQTYGTLALGGGGTGATTKAAAFDALSPMTTSGDMIIGGTSAGTGTRVAIGAEGKVWTVVSGAPAWATAAGGGSFTNSQVFVGAGNGYGSSSTKIRRWSTTVSSTGTDISYSDSSTLGGLFVINTTGVYVLTYCDARGAGTITFGASVNSAELTTNWGSITDSARLCGTQAPTDTVSCASCAAVLTATDVVRAHGTGTADYNSVSNSFFRITRVQ